MGIRDMWAGFRDRMLTDPKFIRWASGFWLTRGLAQARAGQMFDLCAGFVYSQVLLVCVQLDLFERLRDGPLSLADLRQGTPFDESGMDRLVRAAIALKLLEKRSGGRIGLGVHGASVLGNPGVAPMILHHAMLYRDLADPVRLLTGEAQPTELSRYWAYARADDPAAIGEGDAVDYSALMHASQALIADAVLSAYPLAQHRCLLDVGGGEGHFLIEAGQRTPGLKLMLFDLPPVAERARARLREVGLDTRGEAHGGSFFADPLPRGADVISLVRILHDHDDEAAQAILSAIHEALPPGGTLLLAEPLAETPGAERMGDAYFGLYLLAMGSGRPRSLTETGGMLKSAGFGDWERVRTPMPLVTSLIKARKSAAT